VSLRRRVLLLRAVVSHPALGLAAATVAAATGLGFSWAPAMALPADAAERTGLHQGLARS
jgi:hypothetical protein